MASKKCTNTFFLVVNTLFMIEGILGFIGSIFMLVGGIGLIQSNFLLVLLMLWPLITAIKMIVLASVGYWASSNEKVLALLVYGWIIVIDPIATRILRILAELSANKGDNVRDDTGISGVSIGFYVLDVVIMILCASGAFTLASVIKEEKLTVQPTK